MPGPHGRRIAPPGRKAKDVKGTFKRLYRFLQPYKIGLIFMIVFTILAAVFQGLAPYVLGMATDSILDIVFERAGVFSGMEGFIRVLLLLAGVYVCSSLLRYFAMFIMANVSQRTMFDLREAVDLKLKKLPLNYFDGNSYGDVLSRVTNDVDTVSNSLQQSLDQIVSSVASIIMILVMMLIVSPWLTLIALVTVPFTVLIATLIIKKSQPYFRGQQSSLGKVNGYVEEMYNGHNVIKAFGREQQIKAEFAEINDELYDNAWKAQFSSGIMMPASQFLTNVGYVGIAIVGAVLVINGRLSVGKIQSFIQYLRQFQMPITQTAQIANILQSTAAAAERIFEFLDASEEPPAAAEAAFPQTPRGKVSFEHVRFGYSPDNILIKDLNLEVAAGDMVAIVGPTGAGKTTLVNLILRFYDVLGGSIKVDDVDIREMGRVELRSLFGMVLQDTWLFTGTIRENIRYGRLTATDEEVEQAAWNAHAHGFIKTLPGGYDMILNEGASNLAQGERQLLTIARAILSDPLILILDEATSSVDTRTEVAIQHAMKNLLEGRTSFVIAHRLSTIRNADLIIFMDDGEIKETGTHDELLQRGGYYAKLYNSQFGEAVTRTCG